MKKSSEKRTLRLGMAVRSQDGLAGRLNKIILQRESMSPSYLVIQLTDARREVMLPVVQVRSVSPGEIVLKTSARATAVFPDPQSTLHEAPPAGPPSSSPPGQPARFSELSRSGYLQAAGEPNPGRFLPIDQGTPIVDCNNELVGLVDGVVFEASVQRGRYVIFKTAQDGSTRLLPASLVAEATTAGLRLFIDRPYIDKLPIIAESG